MTWTLIVYNPTNLEEPLAKFEEIRTIDDLAKMRKDNFNNDFITATKLRNHYHTCKKQTENFIKVIKN